MYDYQPFDPFSLQHLTDSSLLMRKVWGENEYSTFHYLRWQYCQNPNGPAVGTLAYAGDQLATQYILIPSQLWSRPAGDPIPALMSVNTATHPDHRGKGLFVESAKRAFDNSDVKAVYGFPNDSSLPGFLKLGFTECTPLSLFVGIISKRRTALSAASILRHWYSPKMVSDPLYEFYSGAEARAMTIGAEQHMRVAHTQAWLKWRFSNPIVHYSLFEEGQNIAVLRGMRIGGVRIAMLMHIGGTLDPYFVDCLKYRLRSAKVAAVCGLFSANAHQLFPTLHRLLPYRMPDKYSPKKFNVIHRNITGAACYELGDMDLY